jgi:hypothetical protein
VQALPALTSETRAILGACGGGAMKRIGEWFFNDKQPLRTAVFCLLLALLNVYEAIYVDQPGGFMRAVSWVCIGGGLIGFVVFLLEAVSDRASRLDH